MHGAGRFLTRRDVIFAFGDAVVDRDVSLLRPVFAEQRAVVPRGRVAVDRRVVSDGNVTFILGKRRIERADSAVERW